MKGKNEQIEREFRFRPERMTRVPKNKRHLASPQETELRNCKVRVTMYLDADIVEHFKERAAAPDAAPYQTQINNALRASLTGTRRQADYSPLLNDKHFIDAVARRVAKQRRA